MTVDVPPGTRENEAMNETFVTVHLVRDLDEHRWLVGELEAAGFETDVGTSLSGADLGVGETLMERPIRVRASAADEAREFLRALSSAPAEAADAPARTEDELNSDHALVRRRARNKAIALVILFGPILSMLITAEWSWFFRAFKWLAAATVGR